MISSALEVEATGPFEILVTFYKITQHHIPEDSNLHVSHCANLKLHKPLTDKSYFCVFRLSANTEKPHL
jgi:hypothetical protein